MEFEILERKGEKIMLNYFIFLTSMAMIICFIQSNDLEMLILLIPFSVFYSAKQIIKAIRKERE